MEKVSSMISSKLGDTLDNIKTWGNVLFNVQNYGIYPDGTDVTGKLQALVNLANYEERSIIFFPNGNYYVTSLTTTENIVFCGDNAFFTGGYDQTINQLGSSWTGLLNDGSKTYGGATSEAHIKNSEGQVTMTLVHAETAGENNPLDTLRIYRTVASKGGSSRQQGGAIIRSTVQSTTDHNEFGVFSVVDNYAEYTTEQVGIYSQITAKGNSESAIWGGVNEVRNTSPENGSNSVDVVLCGLEVDVVNNRSFSDTIKKIGVEVIAYGGGESTEAFSVYAANNTRGNGSYVSGHWRYGFRMLPNSLNGTLGIGVDISSSSGTAIQLAGGTSNYAINIQDNNGGSGTGINIGSGYSRPITIPPNRKILLNTESNSQGIQYNSTLDAIILESSKIGVSSHSVYNSASAGGTQPVPASVAGYLGVYVNGFLKKIPYFNE